MTTKAKTKAKSKKRKPQLLTNDQLHDAVVFAEVRDLRLQSIKQDLDNLRADIRHTMEVRKLKITFALEKRMQAVLVDQTAYAWSVADLKKYLTKAEFTKHCPPKPKADELRKLYEGNSILKRALKKCFTPIPKKNLVVSRVQADTLKKNAAKAKVQKEKVRDDKRRAKQSPAPRGRRSKKAG